MTKATVSIIIPAWNEAQRLPVTLKAIRKEMSRSRALPDFAALAYEVIVVDDGSWDQTAESAVSWADKVVRHSRRMGKGAALESGWRVAAGDTLLFLDADLGLSAKHYPHLLAPVLRREADMVIARWSSSPGSGGFGFVRGLAARGVRLLTGCEPVSPLSGQRAVRRDALQALKRHYGGFGVEVGMLVDLLKLGFSVMETEVPFMHRETKRNWSGWLHRGRQFWSVGRVLWQCWRKPVC
ncbi:glycosyltransferase family 2 protein [Paenibacillus filicis]|uniref:Glycosyltransferase family 2 protein n=1 Tax=Paenibacillus filicis TaxID=669464 RepID=A0ABU9DF52_9BACL